MMTIRALFRRTDPVNFTPETAQQLYEALEQAEEYLEQTIGPCGEECACIMHDLRKALTAVDGRERPE